MNESTVADPSRLSYIWNVSTSTSSANLLSSWSSSSYKFNGKILTINPNVLSTNTNYLISCIVGSIANCGNITQNYTTKQAYTLTNAAMNVAPTSGIAYQTLFNFTVTKASPSVSKTQCAFGYINSVGE
jgi:hypothetical protein